MPKRHSKDSIRTTTCTGRHNHTTLYPPHNIRNWLSKHVARLYIPPPLNFPILTISDYLNHTSTLESYPLLTPFFIITLSILSLRRDSSYNYHQLGWPYKTRSYVFYKTTKSQTLLYILSNVLIISPLIPYQGNILLLEIYNVMLLRLKIKMHTTSYRSRVHIMILNPWPPLVISHTISA